MSSPHAALSFWGINWLHLQVFFDGVQTMRMHRRYSEFVRLHCCLVWKYRHLLTSNMRLPPKRCWWKDNFDPDFLDVRRLWHIHIYASGRLEHSYPQERKKSLCRYLNAIVSVPVLCTCALVREFLGDDYVGIAFGTLLFSFIKRDNYSEYMNVWNTWTILFWMGMPSGCRGPTSNAPTTLPTLFHGRPPNSM